MCACAGALTFVLAGEETKVAPYVAMAALALAAAALGSEARRDLDAVLTLVSFFLIGVAIVVTVYLFSVERTGAAPKLAAVIAGVAGISLGATTIRRQRGASADFPNLLAAHARRTGVWETEGIQFTGHLRPGGGGEFHVLAIFLQNTFDAPRQVTIRFDAGSAAKYLRFHPQYQLLLGAAAVSKVSFPVIAPTCPGSYRLYFSLSVSGSEGRRVRLWRAQEPTTRFSTATSIALLAIGHVHFGGGTSVTVGPLPDDLWSAELPPPVQQTLWEPRFGTVPFASST
jgi:hypothetical protein